MPKTIKNLAERLTKELSPVDIENSIVVVTGAGSGIGRALAVGFVEQGAEHVVCTDLDLASVNETATQIGTKGSARCLDVTDQQIGRAHV